ncbi:BgTH12-04039 [Blumeria graminis f. sp. triticale]|uniref:Bgt-3278 n=3 Tax=Blumeria graminis TaxID=34373 RepID=A0A381LJK8_BLUGR|nr:hypothetical protein BGT96224_3278 [Blumeria graminis f. sp. tritici 96224]CAD6499934.1 BgTH12-04039 [Blumeria graminis f. sp. triticale]VCU40103.1 Bgt-3278 [Blumeria graminis f. sp. tritici]
MPFSSRISAVFRTHRAVSVPRPAACFGTSNKCSKSASEAIKDKTKEVDKAISGKIVEGIEISQNAAEKATKKAKEISGMSTGEVNEEIKGKASEIADQAEDKKEEIKKKI